MLSNCFNFSNQLCRLRLSYFQIISKPSFLSDLVFEKRGSLGILNLNRPQSLNALNVNMIRCLTEKLIDWDVDPNIKVILVKGLGGKAFCSGGDILNITNSVKEGGQVHNTFFQEEYVLDHLTSILKTPYISLYNGVAMGGGIGISVHGKYRVATEDSTFAMPETLIGFHPDVGGSYFLPRLRYSLGMFLALSGTRLKSQDIFYCGIATHFIRSIHLSRLEHFLSTIGDSQEVQSILDDMHFISQLDGEFTLNEHLEEIDYSFAGTSIEEIFDRLNNLDNIWSKSITSKLSRCSPTSLKVSHKSLRIGSSLPLKKCLEMEYIISRNFLNSSDFFEGVRAQLINKDNNPLWKPNLINLVKEEIVESYFQIISEDTLKFYSII